MTQKRIPWEVVEALVAKHGLKMAPPDHPVYSEGPSITFSSRTQKQSGPRVIDLPYTDLPSDSDSAPPSKP
jgi:hypothetical protein